MKKLVLLSLVAALFCANFKASATKSFGIQLFACSNLVSPELIQKEFPGLTVNAYSGKLGKTLIYRYVTPTETDNHSVGEKKKDSLKTANKFAAQSFLVITDTGNYLKIEYVIPASKNTTVKSAKNTGSENKTANISAHKKVEASKEQRITLFFGKFIFPVLHANTALYRVSSHYGLRTDPLNPNKKELHLGTDYSSQNKGNDTIVCPFDNGIVAKSSYDKSNGYNVTILFLSTVTDTISKTFFIDTMEVGFDHLKCFSPLKTGNNIHIGQFVGIMGKTGRTTGKHVHISMKIDNIFIDPEIIINATKRQLISNKVCLNLKRKKRSDNLHPS